MTPIYKVEFRPRAKKRFDRLDAALQQQIARKLKERQTHPRVQADATRRLKDCYKLKLRAAGVRVVYLVQDDRLVILVLSVGRREREESYEDAATELASIAHD